MDKENIDLIKNIDEIASENMNSEIYRKIISYLDVTSLDVKNNGEMIEAFVKKVLRDTENDMLPNVAAVCVSPIFVENAGIVLGGETPVALCSVAGGFPSSHTFLEVKMLECAMAMENGADEIDVVINVGDVLYGGGELAASELEMIREELGEDIVMKVIIESGELNDEGVIRRATAIAMAAGADFVKTSTGKTTVSATPEAVAVICEEIKSYHEATGRMVGVKISGGISTVEDAARYYTIVRSILGEKWMIPKFFRIGSSSLLEKLLVNI